VPCPLLDVVPVDAAHITVKALRDPTLQDRIADVEARLPT